VPKGGVRPGAGRPKGAKDLQPRVTQLDVLGANRATWAGFARDGLLKKVRTRLKDIVEKGTDKDAVAAMKLILEYDLGRPVEAREQIQAQPLNIFLAAADGKFIPIKRNVGEVGIASDSATADRASD